MYENLGDRQHGTYGTHAVARVPEYLYFPDEPLIPIASFTAIQHPYDTRSNNAVQQDTIFGFPLM